MISGFDDIRCYNDKEIPDVLARLTEEKQFLKILSTVYPLLPKEIIKKKLLSYKTAYEFQKNIVYPFLQNIEATLTKGIDFFVPENLDLSKSYLYISNHRDIILDSALLGAKLIERNMDTVEIAIGDNLLIYPWIEDLVRVNKSFIVKRALSPRQMLESSQKLSSYIRYAIREKKQSVWIAQREGRAKDSNDRTQESLIKMLVMSGEGTIATKLQELNICPITISYEHDPCDYLKAKEFQQKRDDPNYKKQPQDDLLHMQTGVMGYKGKVDYRLAGVINSEIAALAEMYPDKPSFINAVATLIDKKIHKGYTIFACNKIAYDLLFKTTKFSNDYTTMEKLDFERYLERQLGKIDLENRDDDFLMKKMLEMYANPLVNYLKELE